MLYYFIYTSFYLFLYRLSLKLKWYKLTNIIEVQLSRFNVYIYKNLNEINVICLGEWFFNDYYDYYRDIHNDKRYYVLYKLYPPTNLSIKTIKSSAIEKRDIVIKRDGGKCLCCSTTDDLTVDHIIPISKGGDSSYYNLQTLCNSCNSIKGNDIISINALKIKVRRRKKKYIKLKK